jgi:transcriptional regulator of met regulon
MYLVDILRYIHQITEHGENEKYVRVFTSSIALSKKKVLSDIHTRLPENVILGKCLDSFQEGGK